MDSTSPAVLLKVLSSALFIVTLRPPIEVTTIVMSSDILMLYPRSTRFRPHIKRVAGFIPFHAFSVCSFHVLYCAWLPGKDKQWLADSNQWLEQRQKINGCLAHPNWTNAPLRKGMSIRLESAFHLVDVCLFTVTERLLTDNLVSCHTPHACLCIRGNWQRTSSDEHVLSFCSGSPVKTALGSSKCSPLSWPGQHGNCVRNYGN